ncbi:hypothetical protein JQ557_27065 [Bradyrhizobium sp. U87765 SZCCT0131]|uniref:hypothetical protein n=1 Tax=Bradyrhizobium sp. U87765 SZCCT0109 TaxID=2807656 RepID=UPI001BA55F62|nr:MULTISPECIES: hypothetical protein [unclassified Bradyrhizobium]MBR1221691.1 hypothetical protein [Bradyrhizobium sp. U87765 SZCCT0131]MBR1264386.1 hypothetical protein [Bradyrhizobium sp. U87765 SZCCT0134]MBR1304707.1 hypothetical protein [Bradyrhizobium sp. U87765 SZCCT0110]MBR1322436.1 hypothetical protein [Bradyrhizobium sp. U87765 SZCCT0109]MBR1346636.1 hypothetical protein [Bradyrhizobium sp. U87765 SZCCT0048]
MLDDAPRFGLKTRIRNRELHDVARECIELAHSGLRRRGRLDHLGRDESCYLALDRIVDSGRTAAEEMVALFNGPWRGSVAPTCEAYGL